MNQILYAGVGIIAGILSGFFGIGGGIVIVPMLLLLFGLSQHEAQGTSLAIMIPPIGLLAAYKYYMNGHVKLNIAVFVCMGFFIGGYLGAHFAQHIPDMVLKRIFGVLMLMVSIKMIIGR